jgi:excinuclease UvrABC nuclease subunit
LVAQIEREYKIKLQESTHYKNSYFSFNKASVAKKFHKLLQENTERFLNGYTFSRFASEDPASRQALLEQLKEQYELPKTPIRIECVDISHF